MKRTKIIATIGPASGDVDTLKVMMKAGMNVARLNFSHGTETSHAKLIANIRSAAGKLDLHIPIIQDLSGPKLRLGECKEKSLKPGEHVVLGQHGVPVARHIWEWVKVGQVILIDDGLIELVVIKVNPDSLETKVIQGGTVISHKGLSLPGVNVSLPSLSEKDLADLEFGIKSGVDFIALSFVKTAKDIKSLKKIIQKSIRKDIPVISKIETPEAIKNIDEVIEASDAVMVARGDLALNVEQEDVPLFQKTIVHKCLEKSTPVIVATQMLDSMIKNSRPTRAEVSDVANAVIDHADAVMLSGETAFGSYPLKTVETMSKIIEETEKSKYDNYHHSERRVTSTKDKQMILAHTIVHFSRHARVKAIIVNRLEVAADVSRFRPEMPVVFISKDLSELRKAQLLWGIVSLEMRGNIPTTLKNNGLVMRGEHFLDATKLKFEANIQLMH